MIRFINIHEVDLVQKNDEKTRVKFLNFSCFDALSKICFIKALTQILNKTKRLIDTIASNNGYGQKMA